MTCLLAQHNVSIAVADTLSPIIRNVFTDSEIAKGYSCGRTKSTCILNHALADVIRESLVEKMKTMPYSLSIDGSNDKNEEEKLNPLTVKYWDPSLGRICTQLLDMCVTKGKDAATSRVIFATLNEKMQQWEIPWKNCVAFGVDNASVNIGQRNSIMTRVHALNPGVLFVGCPCHMLHNAAQAASKKLQNYTGFDIEDFMVDCFFWFQKSQKRKSSLEDFCTFCEVEYRKILKYVSTRWLSLNEVTNRILLEYAGLRSYFLSEQSNEARFQRLYSTFDNPLSEVYLLFYQAALPTLVNVNQFLQRQDPCIHILRDQMLNLVVQLLKKFIKPRVIKNAQDVTGRSVRSFENQLSDEELFIGFSTKQLLRKLEKEGDLSSVQRNTFFNGVREFYCAAVEYLESRFCFNEPVFEHAVWANFYKRQQATFSSVMFFVEKYSDILNFAPRDIDLLQDQFVDYQLLPTDFLPPAVSGSGQGTCFARLDDVWTFLAKARHADGQYWFPHLSKVAEVVMLIPHSNAEEERIFSIVRKTKTDFRPSLSSSTTLTSLIMTKLAMPDGSAVKFEPSKELLTKAKKATMMYNREHLHRKS